jgi:hypothetical protein
VLNNHPAAIVGRLCHQTIESILKDHVNQGYLDNEEVLKKIQSNIAQKRQGNLDWDKILCLSQENISRWVELWNRFFSQFTVKQVEDDFTLSIGTSISLVGRIDLVAHSDDGSIWAVDWKTGHTNPKDQAQVETYAIWVFESNPDASKIVAAIADIHNVSVRQRSLTTGAISAIRSMLRTRAMIVEKLLQNPESARCQPGKHCINCPVLNDCEQGFNQVKYSNSTSI